ncbi:class I adenylate-forming enzyme family protein [Nonomuraea sp. NPDC050556]|uniref:class I adenylate-forming enzyme family protein n=1 Tax=Nonomuraea sp. NPDC050556 TaxID=3364369 RepID=UPI0037AF6554
MDLTIPHLLSARAESEPDRLAMIVHGRSELTFGDWSAGAETVARGLNARGVKPGDRVGLSFQAAEWTDYAVAFCGVLRAGAVAVPLNDRLTATDLRTLLADCAAVGLLHGADQPGDLPCWSARLGEGPNGDLPGLPRPRDPAQILYTSGTTGRPKGVVATHANLAYGLGGRRRPFAHSKHLAHAFPIGTNAGQTMLVNALDANPAVVTLPHFTPGRFAALIEHYGAGTVFLVPAMAIELLNAGVRDLSSVLLLGSAAAPLPASVAQRLTQAFPKATITNYYTSTEAAPAQTIMMFDPERPGSVGRAVAGGGVRIATADGSPVTPGEVGEVWMRSPAAPRAYYGDPGSEVFKDGWVRMGDLGRIDEDGYLYLVDRQSDLIKSGAFKVSTIRIEEAVYEHETVVEAAALGVPHPVLGKAIAVAVVTRAPLTAEDLRIFLKDRLAPHEVPTHVITLDALPRNRGGKVDKRLLLERF